MISYKGKEYVEYDNAIALLEEKDNEIERLNNDIKELLKENENKEKVIKAQDNIIKEVREYITTIKDEDIQYTIGWIKQDILEILDKVGGE